MADSASLASLAEPALQFLRSVQLMVRLAKEPTIGQRAGDFFESAKMAHNDFKFLQLLSSKTAPSQHNIPEIVRVIHTNLVALVKHLRDVVEAGAALDQVPPHIGEAIWGTAEAVKQIVAAAQQDASSNGTENSASQPSGFALASPRAPAAPFNSPQTGSQSVSTLPNGALSPRLVSTNGAQRQEQADALPSSPGGQNLELDLTKVQSAVRSLGSLADIFFGENRGQSRSHVAPAAAELTRHSFELQVASKAFGMQDFAVKLMERTTDVLFTVKQAVATREHPEAMLALDEAVKALASVFKELVRGCAQKGISLITSAQPAPAPNSIPSPTQLGPIYAGPPQESVPPIPTTVVPPSDSATQRSSSNPTVGIPAEGSPRDFKQAGSRPSSGELTSESDSDEEGALEDMMDMMEDAFADLAVEEPAAGDTPPGPERTVSPGPAGGSPPTIPQKPAHLSSSPVKSTGEPAALNNAGGEPVLSAAAKSGRTSERRKRFVTPFPHTLDSNARLLFADTQYHLSAQRKLLWWRR